MYAKTTTSATKIDRFFQPGKVNQQMPCRKLDELEKMQGLLNSQRIKLIFDNYGVELILQENNVRISNLNSNGVMRTFAVVHFSLPASPWLKDTHNKIYSGSTIGQTIKDDGFDLTKEDVYFGITELPEIAKNKMKTTEESAAIHIYQLTVKKPNTSESIVYCTITEVHSPLYLTLGDLRQLSPEGTQKYSTLTESAQKHLNELRTLDEWLESHSNKSLISVQQV
ncbi:hypothetical protein [Legionella bozemanae]|uniref:Uncharacterized protein n=1 Tax=Legionella bozemanae TaxID=447 RepID=A0A0W0S149_LEGBO|nr:hypothetical protein [Legionella bozemanae]KTC77212.1 hypothetical protein Lboz_0165 [Legionella bozemanae]STO32825.1 Uncharacterised protein [Legionella bozemanae]